MNELPSGLDLDIQIAQKIMGLNVLQSFDAMKPIIDLGGDFFGKKFVCTISAHNEAFNYMGPSRKIATIKRYSNFIEPAFEVLGKVPSHGWELYSEWAMPPRCTIFVWDSEEKKMQQVVAVGQSVPHSICLAALKRMELDL